MGSHPVSHLPCKISGSAPERYYYSSLVSLYARFYALIDNRDLHTHTYTLTLTHSTSHTNSCTHTNTYTHTANQFRNITNNVRIGFGSFNDKPIRPYTYIPVPNALGVCNIPLCSQQFYAFRHQITLTDNITFYSVSIHCMYMYSVIYRHTHSNPKFSGLNVFEEMFPSTLKFCIFFTKV